MSLAEKAAYIRGLAEGLELDTDKKEARIIKEMLELMGEMATDVDDIGADLGELFDVVEQIDEDLGHIEEEVYTGGLGDFSDEMYEIECPNCKQTVQLDEEVLLDGDVICPACGEKIEIEIDDCDCGHDHSHKND